SGWESEEATDAPYVKLAQKFAEAGNDLSLINELEANLWLDGIQKERTVSGEIRNLFLDMNMIALKRSIHDSTELSKPAFDRLQEVKCPVLTVCGDLDLADVKKASEY